MKTSIQNYIKENFKGKIQLKHDDYKIIMIEFDEKQKEIIEMFKERGELISGNKSNYDIWEVEAKIEL